MIRSTHVPGNAPAVTPSTKPSTPDKSQASPINGSEAANLLANTSATGALKVIEVPRSP